MPTYAIGSRVKFDGRTGTVVGHRPSGMTDVKFDDSGLIERRHESRLMRSNGRLKRNTSYRSRIQKLLDTAPSSWRKMFREQGLSENPSVEELIELQERTAGGRDAGPKGRAFGSPPPDVRAEAFKGLLLSHQSNYPSWNGIGLARAAQLATATTIYERDAKRMRNYFSRHTKDQSAKGFGSDTKPSRGYLAWLNWGGDSGRAWVD